MNITYIPGRSITLVTSKFKVLTASKDNPNWSKIEAAVKANDEQTLINLISPKKYVEGFGNTGKIEVRGSDVFYRGEKLFGEDVNRIFAYLSSGAPEASMLKFLDAKFKNVDTNSVTSLYRFLENKEMPITDNGTVLGFKGVRSDLYSVHTGQEPLISGVRRSDGSILNDIGETVWMERRYVDCNANNPCGPGLHIGSRRYAKGWGPRVMVVEFSPEDVCMVPNNSCEVLRVNKYRIVGELTEGDYLGETYNGDYSRPVETPEPEEVEVEVVIEPAKTVSKTPNRENIFNISNWSRGQAEGFKDGKAHAKRKFYEVDKGSTFKKYSKEFINGYLVGYKDGRK